ncbi:chitinase [Hydrogenispora ethanolica]|uniref:chitinase n=1 Tax=Hydrogenispora ethanolica TaxID=1082276 RepID=A0A4R1RH23_HYDET|nr:glycosyl hydrolase family 18 protein [Hydrogenispora ethanolica]TCL65334.1 chitinase [Hydrogenispora ethanolica]
MKGRHRNVIYYQDQTHPLAGTLAKPFTHVIVAAFHFQADGAIRFHNDSPDAPRFAGLWRDVAAVRESGRKILMMLGGAGNGTWRYIHQNACTAVETLLHVIDAYQLDGIDLDWEEWWEVPYDPEQLFSQLISDLSERAGRKLIITMAPVARQIWGKGPGPPGLYQKILENTRGRVNWFNVQFYSGFGSLQTPADYRRAIRAGFEPHRLVAGSLTGPQAGEGYIDPGSLALTVRELAEEYPDFGGVDGWEYVYTVGTPWANCLQRAMNVTGR